MVIDRRAVLAAIALLAACQGSSSSERGAKRAAGSGSAISDARVVDAVVAVDAGDSDAAAAEPEPVDPGRMIADLGAIPAWQAVVDRSELLARRGQHGIVFGRIGPPVVIAAPPVPAVKPGAGSGAGSGSGSGTGAGSGSASSNVAPAAPAYVWLIDDTEGNGSLAIRLALGDKQAALGDRIAAGGAWQLDEDRRWFWKLDTLQPLPPPPASDLKDPQPATPGHAIGNGELPSGARTISVSRDGDAVYFQIVGPSPTNEGDGWQVADELGNPTFAIMNLPGERPSYGGHDMRAADERWQLKRGQTYWVRIGKLRKRGADKPPLVNARTAPVRVL